jgi:hypothetical protein
MPENAILLVPLIALIVIAVLVRRGTTAAKPRTAGVIEVELKADTAPLIADLKALNPELERTIGLLDRVETSAGAISRAARAARTVNESNRQQRSPAPQARKTRNSGRK